MSYIVADYLKQRRMLSSLRHEQSCLLLHIDSLKIANNQIHEAWMNTIIKVQTEYDWIFFGNSITRNSDFRDDFPNKRILNLGLGGDDLHGLANRSFQLGKFEYERVYVMAGINSVGKLTNNEFVDAYEIMLDSLLFYVPKDKLIIQNMLPVSSLIENEVFNNLRIQLLNEKIDSLCKKYEIRLIDVHRCCVFDGQLPIEWTKHGDGLHINDSVYNKWTEVIKSTL